jgi:hypothetical protein
MDPKKVLPANAPLNIREKREKIIREGEGEGGHCQGGVKMEGQPYGAMR